MTNFWMFVQWQWRRFDTGQKLSIFAIVLVIASIVLPDPYKDYTWLLGMGIIVAVGLKWFIWDRAVESYAIYKKQRDDLFKNIRGE